MYLISNFFLGETQVKRSSILISALIFGSSLFAAPHGQDRGATLYRTCTPCHGNNAEGNAGLEAPSLAGLSTWYIESQIVKFQKGIRGAHPKDRTGLLMRPMSRTITSKSDLKAVAKWIHALPPVVKKENLNGDAKRGATLFATCVACHGPKAEGNVALKAPSLNKLAPWYIVNQLTKFRSGIRGAHPKDTEGKQMAPMAQILPDEKALTDVATYISTLGIKPTAHKDEKSSH